MNYFDVVIHTNRGYFGHESLFQSEPPLRNRLQLSEDIWIESLDYELANSIMDVCEPKWLGQSRPGRMHSQLYTFMREVDSAANPIFHWDHDHQLVGVVALSRLVHPTQVGFSYAARVAIDGGRLVAAVPALMQGVSREAFISPNNQRDWLTLADGEILAQVAPYVADKLPHRVHKALWYHESAARNYYLDLRWTLVCIALEALIHTDRIGSTKQFVKRVKQLADDNGISIQHAACEDGYNLRCELAHTASFLSTTQNINIRVGQIELYDKLEEILRSSVLRAVRDPTFASIFEEDDRIRRRWPV